MSKNYSAREAAFLAVFNFLKTGTFVLETLEQWQKEDVPSRLDFNLAYDIAGGSVRLGLALDFISKQLASRSKISLKVKEKAILRSALYQAVYRKDIPLYAVGQEMGTLAKKYCHPTFCAFLNAVLRNCKDYVPKFPLAKTAEAYSVRFSYPVKLVQTFLDTFGIAHTEVLLERGNTLPIIMVRMRRKLLSKEDQARLGSSLAPSIKILKDREWLSHYAKSPDFYIQNATPYLLMEHLRQGPFQPQTILDLCASPGGKTLIAHDFFPNAKLYANDVSEQKLVKLRQNFEKYNLEVSLSCSKGEDFPLDKKFDLIIIDAPCSNTGVLFKRAEARWRFTEENLKALKEVQIKLLEHAQKLLNPNGQIWYLTCSIVQGENEQIVSESGLSIQRQLTIYPDNFGLDGGFACSLSSEGGR